jgi:3-(3-hydroxy-phenyl)propionate hydroxylase/flavoprotein hydroxylase
MGVGVAEEWDMAEGAGPDVDPDVDVVVVGYGPVGMTTAALLGRLGHRVLVLERYAGLYNLPRAAILDDETIRTFAVLDIVDELLPKASAQASYEWRNGSGELLTQVDYALVGRSGWPEWIGHYQPDLEDALDAACRSAGVRVEFDSRVVAIESAADRVRLTVGGPQARTVTARYVIACDGGNSFVRDALGIDQDDYGFSEPWMVCDFRLLRPTVLPGALQIGDPHQPTSVISLGPHYHRFSFMLDSVSDFEVERAPEKVWHRVARFLTPDDAELIRVATYTFRSLVAHRWRVGRILLAGDAAHQMPPFLGQGMCSGVRDAQNLAFKLDLVLRGRLEDTVLDSYQSEREPHVRAVIEKGVEMGRRQTVRDPALAAERDRVLLAKRAANEKPDKIRFPGLGPGMVSATPGAGTLSVQGMVQAEGRRGHFDHVVGSGWQLLVEPALATAADAAALAEAKVRVVALGGDGGPADVEGTYRGWFAELGCAAVVVRPDFYVYGTATDADSLRALVAELLTTLGDDRAARRAAAELSPTG